MHVEESFDYRRKSVTVLSRRPLLVCGYHTIIHNKNMFYGHFCAQGRLNGPARYR